MDRDERIFAPGGREPHGNRAVKHSLTAAQALLVAICLSGCATSADKQAFYDAQLAALKAQQPLVQLVAQPGQAITGLQSLTVYAPPANGGGMQQLSDPYANVLVNGMGIVGTVAGVYFGGQAAVGLATAVGNSAGHNTQFSPVVGSGSGMVINSPGSTGLNTPAPVVVVPQATNGQ